MINFWLSIYLFIYFLHTSKSPIDLLERIELWSCLNNIKREKSDLNMIRYSDLLSN